MPRANLPSMSSRILAFAFAASACGDVTSGPPDGNRLPDGALTSPYKGTMTQTQPVAYGGGPQNYCMYTITLKQLEIELDILPSKQVASGRVQNLNVEATNASCPYPVIPANVATYTLVSSTPLGGGESLVFQGGLDNAPTASLVATLAPAGSNYTAALTFHRTDTPEAVLAWTVMATVTLSPP
jgi:hypothetical protein